MGCARDIIVVCEDRAHRAFVRQCLKSLGVRNLEWHWQDYTASIKRAEHGNRSEVISRLENNEYGEWLRRNSRTMTLLIAVIDADGDDINVARRKLKVPQNTNVENNLFVAVIPKRNIQTWVELANSNSPGTTDDCTDYKTNVNKTEECAKYAARRLMERFNSQITNPGANLSLQGNVVWLAFRSQMNQLRVALQLKPWI